MSQTAAHLIDHVIPHVPVRQWVLSPPIPVRLLLAAQPKLMTPVLQVAHRVITGFLLDQASLKAGQAGTGAPTVIRSLSRRPHPPMKRCRRCCTRSSPT